MSAEGRALTWQLTDESAWRKLEEKVENVFWIALDEDG